MAYIGKVPADVLVDPLVTSASLVDGTIITADIADDAVTSAKLAANSVDSSELINGSIDNDHLAGSIAINKTLLAGGTGLTLSTNTLNVDAAQTQITSVGTIGTGVWNGTAVASAYLDADTAHLSGTQTFTGAKSFSSNVTLSKDGQAVSTIHSNDDAAELKLTSFYSGSARTWSLFSNNAADSFLISDGTTRFTLTDTSATFAGAININTTVDQFALLVDSSHRENTRFHSTESNQGTRVILTNGSITSNAGFGFVVGDGGNNRLSIGTSDSGGGMSDLMTILNTGSVGIGITSPDEVLHVYGSSNPAIKIEAPAGQRPQIISESGDATECQILFNQGATTHSMVQGGCSGNQTLKFYTGGTTLGMTIDASQKATFAGQILANDGTPGAPSYSFSTDPNTGIYWSGTDAMGFVNAGTLSLEVRADGSSHFAGDVTVTSAGEAKITIDSSDDAGDAVLSLSSDRTFSIESLNGDNNLRIKDESNGVDIVTFSGDGNKTSTFAGVVNVSSSTTGALNILSTGTGNATYDAKLYISKASDQDWFIRGNSGNDNYGMKLRGGGSYGIAIVDHSPGSYRARISYNGYIYSTDGLVHDIDSDERLKENVSNADSQWKLFKDLPLQKFKWKDRRHGDNYSHGWIAQEVQKKYPDLVEEVPQPKEDIDAGLEDEEYLTVKTGIIQRLGLKALQEAMEKIENLEAKVTALENA